MVAKVTCSPIAWWRIVTKTTKRKKLPMTTTDLSTWYCRISDTHRAHTTLMDTLKIKDGLERHNHRSRTAQYDAKKSNVVATREYLSHKKVQMCTEKSDAQNKDGVNLEGSSKYHFKSDQLGSQAQISLHRGRSRLLPNKRPEKKPVAVKKRQRNG